MAGAQVAIEAAELVVGRRMELVCSAVADQNLGQQVQAQAQARMPAIDFADVDIAQVEEPAVLEASDYTAIGLLAVEMGLALALAAQTAVAGVGWAVRIDPEAVVGTGSVPVELVAVLVLEVQTGFEHTAVGVAAVAQPAEQTVLERVAVGAA